jgi:hypothetical protein
MAPDMSPLITFRIPDTSAVSIIASPLISLATISKLPVALATLIGSAAALRELNADLALLTTSSKLRSPHAKPPAVDVN